MFWRQCSHRGSGQLPAWAGEDGAASRSRVEQWGLPFQLTGLDLKGTSPYRLLQEIWLLGCVYSSCSPTKVPGINRRARSGQRVESPWGTRRISMHYGTVKRQISKGWGTPWQLRIVRQGVQEKVSEDKRGCVVRGWSVCNDVLEFCHGRGHYHGRRLSDGEEQDVAGEEGRELGTCGLEWVTSVHVKICRRWREEPEWEAEARSSIMIEREQEGWLLQQQGGRNGFFHLAYIWGNKDFCRKKQRFHRSNREQEHSKIG